MNVEQRIREAYVPVERDAVGDWNALIPTLADATTSKRPSRIRLHRRTLLVVALVLCALAAVAVAQPGAVRTLFGSEQAAEPADQMDVFQHRRERNTPGLAIFDEPAAEAPDGDHRPLGEAMLQSTAAAYHDETLPIEYMRSLIRIDDGEFEYELVAIPTKGGLVCTHSYMKLSGGSTCTTAFTPSYPIRGGHGRTAMRIGSHEPFDFVEGLASDDVQRIRIELRGGRIEAATMGRNAYFWRGDTGERPHAILVTMKDGRELSFTPAPPRPPSLRCMVPCGPRNYL